MAKYRGMMRIMVYHRNEYKPPQRLYAIDVYSRADEGKVGREALHSGSSILR